MRLLIHFARFGPYHHARLRAAHEVLSPLGWEVIGLEVAGTDSTYAWDQTKGLDDGPRVVTAFPGRVHEEITAAEYRQVLLPLLDSLRPDAMAIAGWGSTDALMCLSWCRKNDVRRFVMSETRAADGKRVWWKEILKRYLISRFDGALVGGKSHRDYLLSLGMKSGRIAFGYNVVDNGHFWKKTEDYKTQDTRAEDGGQRSKVGGQESGERGQGAAAKPQDQGLRTVPHVPDSGAAARLTPYFLASNRFIERKNLARLIDAYALYVKRQESGDGGKESGVRGQGAEVRGQKSDGAPPRSTRHQAPSTPLWQLCLLGDGELKPSLIAQCQRLGLQVIESAPWEVSSSPSKIKFQQSSLVNRSAAAPPAPGVGPLTSDLRTVTFSSSLSPDSCPLTSGLVFFPGFRQIEELPHFYTHAGCFIHPAMEEPWGLVINEAMACGLPILSSGNVGAAEELVVDGVNGWIFDAESVEEMAYALGRMATLTTEARGAMGETSRRLLEERCPTRAFGDGLAKLLGA